MVGRVPPHLGFHPRHGGGYGFCVAQQIAAGGGQFNPPALAMQKWGAHQRLEIGKALAGRRSDDAMVGCGTCNAARGGDAAKQGQSEKIIPPHGRARGSSFCHARLRPLVVAHR